MDLMKQGRLMGNQHTHTVKLAEMLNRQREEQPELCDVSININGKEIKAHWCVLVSCPFFESMYSSGLAEKTSGRIDICIGQTYALEKVLNFLYTGKIHLNMEELEDILEVADYLQCLDMKKLCNDFLACYPLDSKNCVQISILSSLYDLKIQENATRYMKGHLEEVFKGDDILKLTQDSVMSLFTDETLSYLPQDLFFKFLIRWTKHDIESRRQEAKMLFNVLNIEAISSDVFIELQKDTELNLVFPMFDINKALTKRRKDGIEEIYFKSRDVILMGGGVTSPDEPKRTVDRLYAFNLREEKWTELWRLPCSFRKPLMRVSDDQTIYIIDVDPVENFGLGIKLYTLYAFEIENKIWKMIKLHRDRNFIDFTIHDLIIWKNRIFLLGKSSAAFLSQCKLNEVKEDGSIESTLLFNCKYFDSFHACNIDENRIGIVCEWYQRKQFSIKYFNMELKLVTEPSRAKSCISTLSYTKIFSNEGNIVKFDMKRKLIRMFSPEENRWTSFPKMTTPPVKLTNSAMYSFYKDQLYVFGGEKSMKAYKYICNSRKWMVLDNIPGNNFLCQSATCKTTLPFELISCHLKCPHCFYRPKGMGVEYPSFDDSERSYEDSSDYYDEDAYDWDNDQDDDEYDEERSSNCSLM